MSAHPPAAARAGDPHAIADTLNARLSAPAIRVGSGGGLLPAPLPTGFAALDAATRLGGLPRGRLTELIGRPTSGRASVAMRCVARAPGYSAWIDIPGLVDVHALAEAGVALDRLFVLRPRAPLDALGMAAQLVAANGFDLVVLDALGDLPAGGASAQALAKLARVTGPALGRGATALLVLNGPETPSRPLAHAAALRISFSRVGLIRPGGVFRGWRTRAQILKSPGLQGGELGIEVWL